MCSLKGYRPLLVLPKESRSINITKLSNSTESSYLAIKNKKGKIIDFNRKNANVCKKIDINIGDYELNGNFLISTSGQYILNGSM